eukprot:jgi/Psemu1/36276/gm1.36276_g
MGNILRVTVRTTHANNEQETKQIMDNALASCMHATRCAVNHTMQTSPRALAFGRDMMIDTRPEQDRTGQDSSGVFDGYSLKQLQQLLNNSTEVPVRLLPKCQNVSPVGVIMSPPKQSIPDQIKEAQKALGNLIAIICDLEKINNHCAAVITKLHNCTAVLDQLRQQMMRVKEDIIEPLCITINIPKKRSAASSTKLAFYPTQKQKQVQPAINVDSNEDLDMNKPKFIKPKSVLKPKSTDSRPAYMKHEIVSSNYQLEHHGGLQKVVDAAICILAFYRSVLADGASEPEGLTLEWITKIVKAHVDIIESQPGEGDFKHGPIINTIAVFLLIDDEVRRFHFMLVNGLQSLIS